MLNLSGLCRHFLVVMSRMQQLLALFGVFAILSLSVSDAQRGDVHVSCEKFKEGQTSHCNCTIDKTEADSDKCIRSHPVQEIIIDRTVDGISTHLCDFSNYTSGTLRASHRDANCSSHEISRDEEYILKFETIANRSRDEDAHINCNVSCFDTEYNDGLTKSHDGVPIQFENTGDTSTASVSDTETAPTPENTGDTSTTSEVVIVLAVVVITVLPHLAVCIFLIVDGVKSGWFSGKDSSQKVTAVVLYALYFPGLVYIVIAAVKDWRSFKKKQGTSTASENTRDTSAASVNATETATTPDVVRVLAVVVITVLPHLAVCIFLIVDGVKSGWFSGKDSLQKVTAVVLYALNFAGLVYVVIAAVKDWWPFSWRHRALVVFYMIIPPFMVVYLILAAGCNKWPFGKEKSGRENSNDPKEFDNISSSPDKQKKTSKKVDSEHTNSYNRV